MQQSIFITGTDTGIGKTFVTLELAKTLIGKGLGVVVMKPISTGPQKDNDAVYLKKQLKLKDPLAFGAVKGIFTFNGNFFNRSFIVGTGQNFQQIFW